MADTQPKRMNKEYYYPTQVYFSDLQDGEKLNETMLPFIYAWRQEDPEGVHRTNTPQLGTWHSPTDMHTRSEPSGAGC